MLALEYSLLTLLLAFPGGFALACLLLQGKLQPALWAKLSYAYLGLLILVILTILNSNSYSEPLFTIDLFSPGEGDFELTLNIAAQRLKWILALTITAICFVRKTQLLYLEREERGLEKFVFLYSAFWCAAMAMLMDKLWLTFLFAETMLFFLHAFATTEKSERLSLDGSYLARNVIFFGGAVLVTLASVSGLLPVAAAIAVILAMYIIASLITRSVLQTWTQAITLFFIFYLGLFIVHRVASTGPMAASYQTSKWLLFAAALFFAVRALLANSIKGTYHWLTNAIVCSTAALALPAHIAGINNVEHYSLFTLATLAVLGFLFSSRLADSPSGIKKWLLIAALIIGHYFSLGMPLTPLFPAVMVGLGGGQTTFVIFYSLLVFLLTLAFAKLLPIIAKKTSPQKSALDKALDLYTTYPALAALGLAYALLLSRRETWPAQELTIDNRLFIGLPLILYFLALGLGYFLGSKQKFLQFLDTRAERPRPYLAKAQSALLDLNQLLVSYPGYFMEKVAGAYTYTSSNAAALMQKLTLQKIEIDLGREILSYGRALSQYIRLVHTGELRFYLFLAELFVLATIAILFGSSR